MPFEPVGDQPRAIAELTDGLRRGDSYQTLLGVTGSGKTFSISNVIQDIGKPTLVMSHNKTLAAQLYAEFKQFFPENAVEFFISYYDYYQPEAYIVKSDTYIEKRHGRQRPHRPVAAAHHERAGLGAARCDRRGERLVHLRPGFAR